jgi:hypothetical protein
MSSLYGYVPNVAQQQNPNRPLDTVQAAPNKVEVTPATAPSIVSKVAQTFKSGTAAATNTNADPTPDKAQAATLAASPKNTGEPELRLAAESKVAAAETNADDALTPADLADQKAQELAQAREHANQYREYKDRIESAQNDDAPRLDDDGNEQPRMDMRLPLVDEIPDRPLPRLGVPMV